MAPPERCTAARDLLQIRLHLAALQEIIDELHTVEESTVEVAGRDEPLLVSELLERCLVQRESVRRELVRTN